MLTPLTSTPSLARMRMYRVPSIMRVSTRSLRSGLTWMVTSGVRTSSCLGSTRLRGLRPASGPKAWSYWASKASTWGAATPQEDRTDRTSPLESRRGCSSLLALCSSIMSRSWLWTAWTT